MHEDPDEKRWREWFAKTIEQDVRHFCEDTGAKYVEYFKDEPRWLIQFRHPGFGVVSIDITGDEKNVRFRVCPRWIYSDFDREMYFADPIGTDTISSGVNFYDSLKGLLQIVVCVNTEEIMRAGGCPISIPRGTDRESFYREKYEGIPELKEGALERLK